MSKKGKGGNNPIQKNNKKMKNNYFTSMIDRYGEDFRNNMNYGYLVNNIQKDSSRIFREMMGGNIDMTKYAKYFANPTFLNTLIDISYNMYTMCEREFYVFQYYISCEESKGVAIDNMYIKLREQWRNRKDIYSIINIGLNNFRVDPNPGHLVAMCSNLNMYSNQRYLII